MSYISTLVDFSTGLIYVGNGQYFDPETGRFLTRGVNPNGPNPYVPWNPITLMLAPLGLISIQFSRKKLKKTAVVGSLSFILVACARVIALLIVLALALGACSTHNTPTDTPPSAPVPPNPSAPSTTPSAPPPPTPAPTVDPCANNQCTP